MLERTLFCQPIRKIRTGFPREQSSTTFGAPRLARAAPSSVSICTGLLSSSYRCKLEYHVADRRTDKDRCSERLKSLSREKAHADKFCVRVVEVDCVNSFNTKNAKDTAKNLNSSRTSRISTSPQPGSGSYM